MFDAHAHLDHPAFDGARDALLERAAARGVRGIVSADTPRPRRAIARELAQRPGVWACAGIHPWAVGERDEAWARGALEELERALAQGGWAALGELGLDRTRARLHENRALQCRVMRAQLAIAARLDLPVVVHAVGGQQAIDQAAEQAGLGRSAPLGLMHGWGGSPELAVQLARRGWTLSFGGALTAPGHAKAKASAVEIARRFPRHWTFESDAPSGPGRTPDEPGRIETFCDWLAAQIGAEPAALYERAEANARRALALSDQALDRPSRAAK